MGAPKATDIPAAAAAEKTSRFLARWGQWGTYLIDGVHTFISIDITEELHEKIGGTAGYMYQGALFSKPKTRCNCETLFPLAKLTNGEKSHTNPSVFVTNVQPPKKCRITKPPNTVLISGIPLCLAYGENSRTRRLAHAANKT